MLEPFGATIREACQWYTEHVLNYRTAPTVAEIVEQADCRHQSRRRREKTRSTCAIDSNVRQELWDP